MVPAARLPCVTPVVLNCTSSVPANDTPGTSIATLPPNWPYTPPWLLLADELETIDRVPFPPETSTKFVVPSPSPSVTFERLRLTTPAPDVKAKLPVSV